MANEEWFIPLSWGQFEQEHWEDRFGPIDALRDSIAQAYYHDAYFNRDIDTNSRIAIREYFDQYMLDVYGYHVDEVFDWVAYRDAYGESV